MDKDFRTAATMRQSKVYMVNEKIYNACVDSMMSKGWVVISVKNRVSFEWDLQLHDAKRQVDAVCDLLPSATPNHLFCDQGREVSELSASNKALMMSLHRD